MSSGLSLNQVSLDLVNYYHRTTQWIQRRMVLVVNFFFVFEIYIFFCFAVAICDIVHDVEAMF